MTEAGLAAEGAPAERAPAAEAGATASEAADDADDLSSSAKVGLALDRPPRDAAEAAAARKAAPPVGSCSSADYADASSLPLAPSGSVAAGGSAAAASGGQ
eukprot:1159498-Pyramimonas_sp.AAC.1